MWWKFLLVQDAVAERTFCEYFNNYIAIHVRQFSLFPRLFIHSVTCDLGS
jgi:hypothetical protein